MVLFCIVAAQATVQYGTTDIVYAKEGILTQLQKCSIYTKCQADSVPRACSGTGLTNLQCKADVSFRYPEANKGLELIRSSGLFTFPALLLLLCFYESLITPSYAIVYFQRIISTVDYCRSRPARSYMPELRLCPFWGRFIKKKKVLYPIETKARENKGDAI